MRILILTNNFVGLYSFRKELVITLRNKGYEVIVSAPYDEKLKFFEELGCRLVDTQFNRKGMNPLKDLKLMLSYKKLINQEQPDVVLSYTIKPNLYGGMACQISHTPQLANITGLGTAVETPGWLQKLTILLYKIGLRKARAVFFQNNANCDFCLKHKMVKGRYILLPGSGVNLQYHSLQDYPAETEPIKFVFISRLLKEKGVEEYYSAAEVIKKKYPTTEFHIVGWCEDAYSEKLRELQNKGVIVYHGPVGDVRPLIGMANCTVHPSFYPEGMSNVLLESCAAGRPIITTDRPGCGEVVDNGINGFVVRQQDTDDLIEKIERFINVPYEQKKLMGQNARKKVELGFDRQIVVDSYIKEIEGITHV